MPVGKNYKLVVIVFIFTTIILGCARYERQVAPFKLPENTPNVVTFNGAAIAARSFSKTKEAREVFGFDIRSAGLLPVQVVFDNKGTHPLIIIPDQTFLIDDDGNVWPILDQELAYDRVSKATELGQIVPEATKSGLLLGAAGAVIGAAIGIVTGTNVGEAAGKGAAIGGAAGLISGGGYGFEKHYEVVQSKIKDDLQSRSLQYRAIRPGELAYGFIFYPGEAKTAKVLRLQLKAKDTGEISTFNMKLHK
ncbi:MAG: hypothetical protein APR62_08765 [Smithella sp. SDB]|nr:MAG: hypothetical protein APR62_08765 [Smithella sp. SDB]